MEEDEYDPSQTDLSKSEWINTKLPVHKIKVPFDEVEKEELEEMYDDAFTLMTDLSDKETEKINQDALQTYFKFYPSGSSF